MTQSSRFASLLLLNVLLASQGKAQPTLVERLTQEPSIENALATLPAKAFEDAVLVHKSFSLQEASLESPRVILGLPSDRAVIAFNGDPSHAGYDKLEVIQFNPKNNNFDFFELTYSDNAPPHTDTNPAICSQCHNYKMRPNFETYFFWPGFYGAEDDNYGRKEVAGTTAATEVDGYKAFSRKIHKQTSEKQGRYRFLPIRKYPDRIPDLAFTERRNAKFGRYLNSLNSKKIGMESGQIESTNLKWLILSTYACFTGKGHDYPANYLDDIYQDHAPKAKIIYQQLLENEDWRIHDGIKSKLNVHLAALEINAPTGRARRMEDGTDIVVGRYLKGDTMRRLAFNVIAGLDTSGWNMGFLSRDYNTRFDSYMDLQDFLRQTKLFSSEDRAAIEQVNSNKLCNYSIKMHVNSDAPNVVAEVLTASTVEPSFSTFSTCIGCHDGTKSKFPAAFIPFGNRQLLDRFLRTNQGLPSHIIARVKAPLDDKTQFHMPLNRELPESVRNEILEYLAQFQ